MELREIQLKELEILEKTVEIFNKYNIRYILLGGSCLGAIRHKGFIPWDDDIDIGIAREDYKRVGEIFENELPLNMFLQIHKAELEYPYNFAKITLKGTALVQDWNKHLKMHHGIYIDLFPLDNVPDNFNEFKKYYKKIHRLKLLQSLSYMSKYKNGEKRPFYQRMIINLINTFYSRGKIYHKLENEAVKYGETNHLANLFGAWGIKEYMKKELFVNTITAEFENNRFNIPEKYDEYLTQMYGNYMEFPPEEQRGKHHNVVHVSLTDEYCLGE